MVFEKASRLKIRFETVKGCLTVEDLWDLPLTSERGVSLDSLALILHRVLRQTDTVSFVDPTKQADTALQLKFDIVKHIINVKLTERDTARLERERKAKKERLLEVLARKEDAAVEALSAEEIQRLIATL